MIKSSIKVGIIGHRSLNKDYILLEKEISNIFNMLKMDHKIELLSSLAIGSDTIAAKVALKDNIPLISVIPFSIEKYRDDFNATELIEFNYLIECSNQIIELDGKDYEIAADYLINKCDIIIFVFNGKELPLIDDKNEPINRGGTYHSLLKVRNLNKKHFIIND